MSELAIAHLSSVDPILGGVIRAVGPTSLAVDPDCSPFQALAQAIAHQQLNGTAARTILGRFVGTCGEGGLFPTPKAVLATPPASLRAAGFSFAKIASLRDLAEKTLSGVVPDHETLRTLGDEEIITRLTQVRGIGRWTVEMLLIFRLGRPDILPVDDFGVRNGFRLAYGLKKMPAPKALAVFGARWAPHRSLAAWFLWRAVELARAGSLPQPLERIRLPRIPRRRRSTAIQTRGSPRARGAARRPARGAAKAGAASVRLDAVRRSKRAASPARDTRDIRGTGRERRPITGGKSRVSPRSLRTAPSRRARK
jgi:DNA-3-methyladenine glycosylase II